MRLEAPPRPREGYTCACACSARRKQVADTQLTCAGDPAQHGSVGAVRVASPPTHRRASGIRSASLLPGGRSGACPQPWPGVPPSGSTGCPRAPPRATSPCSARSLAPCAVSASLSPSRRAPSRSPRGEALGFPRAPPLCPVAPLVPSPRHPAVCPPCPPAPPRRFCAFNPCLRPSLFYVQTCSESSHT